MFLQVNEHAELL